jgi:hypothetical protein
MTEFSSWSPIDMVITNPGGDIISKEINEIEGAFYTEFDFDSDGDLEDQILIPDSIFGQYQIQVVPDSTAEPADSFSLYVYNSYFSDRQTLAEDELIQDIPPNPYLVNTFENLPPGEFSILAPSDTSIAALPITFIWTSAEDPNPGHQTFYDLLIYSDSLSGDSITFHNQVGTTFALGDSLPADSIDQKYYWMVIAHDMWYASTPSNQVLSFTFEAGGCGYIVGDINGNGSPNGIDVTYGVAYLKGGNPPPDECNPPCTGQPDPFYAAMDVNGNCAANGIDITYFVSYLKGQQPSLLYCQDCPPADTGVPAVEPIGTPEKTGGKTDTGR